MKQLECKILENKKVADGFYRMQLESAYLAKNSKPGQFVEVRCSDAVEPLLRRPLGIHRISRSGIDLLYEVVGKGTEILARRKSGESLDVIGPLGNGFNLDRNTQYSIRNTVLIAGGIGVAPLLALAEKMSSGFMVLIGACKKEHILCEREFKKLGAKVLISTENGSKGYQGLITDVLKNLLSTIDYRPSTIYACGPTGMLKSVAAIAKAACIPCQVSLEERMACGVGVCLGCPVKVRTHNEYKMVCKDGPVFDAGEITW